MGMAYHQLPTLKVNIGGSTNFVQQQSCSIYSITKSANPTDMLFNCTCNAPVLMKECVQFADKLHNSLKSVITAFILHSYQLRTRACN